MTNDQLRGIQKAWDDLDFLYNVTELLKRHVPQEGWWRVEYFHRLLNPAGDGD